MHLDKTFKIHCFSGGIHAVLVVFFNQCWNMPWLSLALEFIKIFQKDKRFGFEADLHSECQVLKKKATDTSSIQIHPNFKLKDDLFLRSAFLENSIHISSSIFGADKMVWRNTPSPLIRYGPCNKEKWNCFPSSSQYSVGWDAPAHTEELKGDIQKNSFVKTLCYTANRYE